jgi:hypothetical protein
MIHRDLRFQRLLVHDQVMMMTKKMLLQKNDAQTKTYDTGVKNKKKDTEERCIDDDLRR